VKLLFKLVNSDILKIILKKDLVIIGTYPPPIGGISIHIKRLRHFLKEKNFNYIILNRKAYSDNSVIALQGNKIWWVYFLFNSFKHKKIIIKKKIIFHFHISNWLIYLYSFIFSKIITNKVIITVHNEDYFHTNRIKKLIINKLILHNQFSHVIFVSKNLYKLFSKCVKNARFIPAYIPPLNYERKNINFQRKTKLKIASSMWNFSETQINKYGIDLLIRLLNEYDYFELYLFISGDYQKKDVEKYISYKSKNQNIYLLFDKVLYEYLKNFDIIIRANREDGFGMVILEALSLNVKVIASDTCERPDDVIMFKNDNYNSLKSAVKKSINSNKNYIAKRRDRLFSGYVNDLIKIYREAN